MINSLQSQFKLEQSYGWSYFYKLMILGVGLSISFISQKIQGKFNYVSLFVYSFIIVGLLIILSKYHKNVNRNEIYYFQYQDEFQHHNSWFFKLLGVILLPFLHHFYFLSVMKYLKFHSFNANVTIISRAYFLPAFYSITISWLGYFCYGPMTPVFILFSPKVCTIVPVVVFITIIRVLFLIMLLNLIAIHIGTIKEFVFYFILNKLQRESLEQSFY